MANGCNQCVPSAAHQAAQTLRVTGTPRRCPSGRCLPAKRSEAQRGEHAWMVKEWVWQPQAAGSLVGWWSATAGCPFHAQCVCTAYFACISDPGQLSAQESGEATAPQIQP